MSGAITCRNTKTTSCLQSCRTHKRLDLWEFGKKKKLCRRSKQKQFIFAKRLFSLRGSSFRNRKLGQRRLLRRHPDLRDGLRALHPRRCHRRPLSHEDEHAEGRAPASRAEAVQVPPQETGNRK